MSLDSLEKLFIEEEEAADQKLTELGEDGTNEAAAAAGADIEEGQVRYGYSPI